MILVEVTAAVDEYGTLRTFYLSTDDYQSGPTDTPANQAFDNVLEDPGYIGQSAFSDGKTEGQSSLEVGEIIVLNGDGEYDAWATYGWSGLPLKIYRGAGGHYPADFKQIFAGTIASVVPTLKKVVISIKEKAAIEDAPILTTKYAGTNVGPVGLEGTADDLKGRVKPRVYGRVFNIAPPCVNASKLTFQVSDRAVAAIPNVYVKGRPWTLAANYATSSALTAATLTPETSTFATCLAEGLYRLSDDPETGLTTADVDEKATDEEMSVAAIMQRLATDLALMPSELDDQEFAELNADAPYVAGLWVNDEMTFREGFDLLAGSVGAWHGFDTSGVFRSKQLKAPGEPDFDVLLAEVLNGFERGVADRDGIPVWRVTVRYRKFYEVQSTDLAGSVSAERRAALAEEYRSVTVEDAAIKHQFKQAGELTVDTCLTSGADAEAEANRLLALHKVRRDLFDVPLDVTALDESVMQIASTGRLTHSRFGLAGGRNLRVLGRRLELGRNSIRLKMWG